MDLLKYCYQGELALLHKYRFVIMNSDLNNSPDSDQGKSCRFQSFVKKGWPLAVIAVLIVVVLLLLLRYPVSHPDSIPEVEVAVADTATVEVYGEYDGAIRASQSVEVTARVEGVLEEMLFKEGTYVAKGQTLFVIDPRLYQAQVDRARAQLDRAKALLNMATRELERIRPLYVQSAASQLELDNAEAAVECAEADVRINKVNLIEAQITLGYTRVSAPISGYISERMVDVGELVGSGGHSLLASIVRIDTVLVDFPLTSLEYLNGEDRNVNVRCEDDGECLDRLPLYVTITLADGSEYPHQGLVDFADPMVDTKTGTFTVRAEMPNPDGRLLPGEKTKVKVLLDVVEGALTVPAAAVRGDGNDVYVFVVSAEGLVEKRPVTVGDVTGKDVIVKQGLKPGEMVAVDHFDLLSNGMEVKIMDNSKTSARP